MNRKNHRMEANMRLRYFYATGDRTRRVSRGVRRTGMPVIEESIVIARPAMEVFEFFTEPEKIPLYSSNMVEYERFQAVPVTSAGWPAGPSGWPVAD